MASVNKLCRMTVGPTTDQQKYYFITNSSLYENIKDDVGVEEAPESERNRPPLKISALTASVGVKLICTTGSGQNRKEYRIYCASDKLSNAMTSLLDKQIKGQAIKRVRIDQRDRTRLI